MNSKKILTLAGKLVMLLSFYFIAERIVKYNVDLSNMFSVKLVVIVTISIFIYAFIVLLLAKLFEDLLRAFIGNQIIIGSTIFVYCKSNLYKYLPGNIFHYVGRNEIVLENKVPLHTLLNATFIEVLLLMIAGCITTLAFASEFSYSWLLNKYTFNYQVPSIILVLILVCITIWISVSNVTVKNTIIKTSTQIKQIGIKKISILIFTYIFTFILNGIMFIIVLSSIGGIPNIKIALPIIGVYSLSWIIGFITPGAPAGLGIREAIMSAMLFGVIQENLVITAVLLFRIVTILGDVLGFIIALRFKNILFLKYQNKIHDHKISGSESK